MKKTGFTITLLSLVLGMSMLSGCGKEKVPETATLTAEADDIFAKEGESTEKKVEETNEEIPVDARALLKDAMKGITAVRMTTTVNVDALPTSTKDNSGSSLLPTGDETVSEDVVEETSTEDGDTEETIDEQAEPTDGETVEEPATEEVEDKKADKKEDTKKEDTKKEYTFEKQPKYDKNHSALDISSTDTKIDKKDTKATEETPEVSENETEGENTESEEPEKPVYVPTDESTYYINMKVSTDMDTTKAKNYGRLRMNLGAVIDKEEASYVDYSVEPAVGYTIKHSIETGADEEGNSAEEISSKWYKSESSFYGIATIKEILDNSDVVSYNESVDSHIIGLTVDKTLAEKLDVTHDIMDVLFKGKDTVAMTCYLSKADGILTRIVITMTDFTGTALSKVEVQTNNYIIAFEKYNSINKVLIPDTILEGALEITGEENFLSDEDLVKYNFEKLAIEQEMADTLEEEKEQLEESNADSKTTEEKSDEKAEDKGSDSNDGSSADDALKATQSNKKK